MKISRRNFVRTAPLAALAATAGCVKHPSTATGTGATGRITAGRPGTQVVVLGAGLSGLAAAFELDRAGYAVTVLEARSRPGGRVLTWRDPFTDGLHAEMGAEYVDRSDTFARRYCAQFGLRVLDAKLYDAIFVRGKRFRMDTFQNNKEALPYAGTQPGLLFGHEAQYTKKLREKVTDKENLPPEILALDNVSVTEMLLKEGCPQEVLDLYTYSGATENTCRADEMSALTMIKSHLESTGFNELTDEGRIVGGNDRLPKAFAYALAGKVHYRRPVQKIRHDANGAEVFFDEDGTTRSIRAPHLVVALPFSVLRALEVEPGFPEDKAKVIREQAYGQALKIAMQCRTRFWDAPGSLGQRIFTDTKLRRVYHHSINQPGPRGILLSFTSGDDARALGALPEEERLKIALGEVLKIWPEAGEHWEGGATKYWNEDPWTRASYSFTGVGQDRDFLALSRRSEGRVVFAGEHTADARASMNGAIESGVRAAESVMRSASSAAAA